MRLVSLNYSEFKDTPKEWVLESLTLSQINLLVGRNATGKSRVINVINSLAKLLSGQLKEVLICGVYDVVFEFERGTYRYVLEHEAFEVTKEELHVNSEVLLHRAGGGMGRIHAQEIGREMKFQTPVRELAAVARRDAIQHPFLQPLHDWAASVRLFQFGKTLGQNTRGIEVRGIQQKLDDTDTDQVIAIFHHGVKEYGDAFKNAVKEDMSAIGYEIEDLNIQRATGVVIGGFPTPAELACLAVKEKDLPGAVIEQPVVSQGMFRALSLLIQVNYGVLSKRATCILVDDVGEGLDFERSCAMIDLLRTKAQGSALQLIMSTNDRFVMNKVPLEEWCLLQREGHTVRVRNYRNSKPTFERFKVTGLNNFDFLATDFIEKVGSNGQIGSIR